MDTDRNAELASWIDEPWAVKTRLDSPYEYETVPAELHLPEYTLRLVEWAAKQDDWIDRLNSDEYQPTWEVLRNLLLGVATAEETSLCVRDLIYEAEKQWRKGAMTGTPKSRAIPREPAARPESGEVERAERERRVRIYEAQYAMTGRITYFPRADNGRKRDYPCVARVREPNAKGVAAEADRSCDQRE